MELQQHLSSAFILLNHDQSNRRRAEVGSNRHRILRISGPTETAKGSSEWSRKVRDSQVNGYDYPAEGGLRPLPSVIKDMLAYNGITSPDDMTVDWENIYNSMNDPYYEEDI